MPKGHSLKYPVSALFAVNKPSGPTSMFVVTRVKELLHRSTLFIAKENIKTKRRGYRGRDDLKVGQGGTLDPLASGVLVIGVGKGTKKLSQFLECDKEYEATVLLGTSTTTYDSEGEIVHQAPWKHITAETIRESLSNFTGQIQQIPPIYSALKMDGKPLYEYAREGKPLPRAIESRPVTIHNLELISFNSPSEHGYSPPEKRLSPEQTKAMYETLRSATTDQQTLTPSIPPTTTESESATEKIPPVFTLRLSCSSGTYVRTLVHDFALALGSAGHLVKLVRTRQGAWTLDRTLDWETIEENKEGVGEDGERPWEKRMLEVWEPIGESDVVEGSSSTLS